MNHEQQLQLQAYLDGELSDREARKVADLLAENEEARKLFAELQFTKTALVENEPEFKLPESREFFWSKIEREIRKTEQKQVPAESGFSFAAWLHRFLVPASVAAAVAIMGIVALNRPQTIQTAYAVAEEEAVYGEMDSISFRSESERMTVIYLFDKTSDSISDPSI